MNLTGPITFSGYNGRNKKQIMMMTLNQLNSDQLCEMRKRVTKKKPHMAYSHGWDWYASRLRLIEARIDMAKVQLEKQKRGIM